MAGERIRVEGIHGKKLAPHMEKTDYMFAFDEADGVEDSQVDEIVLRFSLANDLDDFASGLIEGLDRGQVFPAGYRLRLAQDAFVPVWIDIEPEDLAAKLAVHNHAARPDGRIRFTRLTGGWHGWH